MPAIAAGEFGVAHTVYDERVRDRPKRIYTYNYDFIFSFHSTGLWREWENVHVS